MNQERLKRIEADIAKIKVKVTEYTARLRELERQKTEMENAGIVALVRDMDILPDELTAFIQAFKAQSNGGGTALPTAPAIETSQNENKEDAHEEK